MSDLYERAGLTEKQREALDLYDQGMGYKRIALKLGISRATVRERLDIARAKLLKARASKSRTLAP